MKKNVLIVLSGVFLAALLLVSTVYAQGDDGYPIETPTETGTTAPTEEPTQKPTEKPTEKPTKVPTEEPTDVPTEAPTEEPTQQPTTATTIAQTEEATALPTEVSRISESVCDGTRIHTALEGLAVSFGFLYDELKECYCEMGASIGDIKLALETVQRMEEGTSLTTLLTNRVVEGMAWSEIWQDLGLVGNEDQQAGEGTNGLVRNLDRNRYQEQIRNVGEDDQTQNQSQSQEQNGDNNGTSGEGGNGEDGEGGKGKLH